MDNPYHDIEQENIKRLVSEREQLRKQIAVLREALITFHDHAIFPLGYMHEGRNAFEAARVALAATKKKP